MSVAQTNPTDRAARLTLRLLERLFSDHTDQVGVRLWEGTQWPDPRPRPATMVLNHPGALRQMLLPGTEVGLGEAYLYDDCDVEGEMEAVFGLADSLQEKAFGGLRRLGIARDLLLLPTKARQGAGQRGPAKLRGSAHSVKRDREAVRYHYDVSNDFYQLWLDRWMVYSCAYFHSVDEGLDTAQERKLDYLCRKLRLQPGQRLLDVGCGWGGLVIHAALHYGVDATGITLSQPQAELANERIAEMDLSHRCRVLVRDYREMEQRAPEDAYDALVSVGMFEHVGQAMLPTYFARAYELLKPGGVFLNHGIANTVRDRPRRGSFSQAYVFPDGELVPVCTTARAAQEAGFEVRDVESLREHYALTLRHWVRRLEANHEQALEYVSEPTYRVWRLFMSSSVYGFASGTANLYQTLLVRAGEGGRSGLPLTRAGWYA